MGKYTQPNQNLPISPYAGDFSDPNAVLSKHFQWPSAPVLYDATLLHEGPMNRRGCVMGTD